MKPMLTYVTRAALGVLSCCPFLVNAEHVVVESSSGETYVLHVDPQDCFLDVVESIQACYAAQDPLAEENGGEEQIHTFKVRMLSRGVSAEQLAKKVRAVARSYAAGATASESADIGYIVKTLANSSLPKIKSAESSLKKAGDRIDPVHPLQFLACIFTNEELKVCVRNLQGRAWVWKDFLSGITETLAQEDARGNVLPYLQDFATRIKIDANILLPILQAGKWERFVNTLIEIVPREGGTDRYNI